MVEGERDVHHIPHIDLPLSEDRPFHDLVDAQDCNVWKVDDGRSEESAYCTHVGNREGRAVNLLQGELTRPGLLGELFDLPRECEDVLRVGVLNDRDHEPLLRVDRYSEVVVSLEDDVPALLIERGIQVREFLEGRDECLHDERKVCELHTPLLRAPLERFSD